ncbi:MAG: hypothetical protein ACQESG_01135 [Nanobdellota archaeon]
MNSLDSLYLVEPLFKFGNQKGVPRSYEAVFSDILKTASYCGLSKIDTSTVCPDELNSQDLQRRLDTFGNSFVNAQIGAQVSRQPLEVALGQGHGARIIQVVSHIGNEGMYGSSIGPDGYQRSNCGALCNIVNHFLADTEPEHRIIDHVTGKLDVWTETPDGDLNFLGKLYHDLLPFKADALAVYDQSEEGDAKKLSAMRTHLTKANLEVQTERALDYISDYVSKTEDSTGRLLVSELAVNGPEKLYMTDISIIRYDAHEQSVQVNSFKD